MEGANEVVVVRGDVVVIKGVVVGVWGGAGLRALVVLDGAEDGAFDATALPDGVFVVPLPCAAAPRAQTSARHVDHAAAAPLVKWAHAQVKGDAAAWRGLFFAAVGDVVAVRDVDALAAAAAPTTFVVPHRLRDGAARHNKRPPCDARERDWVTPLADPGRGRGPEWGAPIHIWKYIFWWAGGTEVPSSEGV